MELADTLDLGSSAFGCAGSSPAPGTTSHPAPAAAGTLDGMTTIRLAWGTAARSGMSGTVTFTPTRRYWREDTRVADEAAPVTVTVESCAA